jgi:hypothetical protein
VAMLIEDFEVKKIVPCSRNRNYHSPEKKERVMVSLRANGGKIHDPIQIHPIKGEYYEIIDGQCRWECLSDLKIAKVKVLLHDKMSDFEVDLMRFEINNSETRSFDWLSECQELAQLNSYGQSGFGLSKRLGQSPMNIQRKIGIGYFPEEAVYLIRKLSLNFFITQSLLWVRTLPEGCRKNDADVYRKYGYDRVIEILEKIDGGELNVSEPEIRAYVYERRLELKEQEQDRILQSELDARLAEIRDQQEAEIEKIKADMSKGQEAEVFELSHRLDRAVTEARVVRQEKAELISEHQEAVAKLRINLQKSHQSELSRKEQSFNDRLTATQEQLNLARQERDKIVVEARDNVQKQLELQFQSERVKLQTSAQKQKVEAKTFQDSLRKLKDSFDRDLRKRVTVVTQKVEEEHQSRLQEIESRVEGLLAERERMTVESQSFKEEAQRRRGIIANMEAENQKALSFKDKAIISKDAMIRQLSEEISNVRSDASEESLKMAEEEARKRTAVYRKKLDEEFEKRVRVSEERFGKMEQDLQIKTEETISDSIAHYLKTCSEVSASVRHLFQQMHLMQDSQKNDVLRFTKWLYSQTQEVIDIFNRDINNFQEKSDDHSDVVAVFLSEGKE